jgi:hypothetical protein
MKVLQKFQESLSAEDFAELEESIQELINEKANIKVELKLDEERLRIEELAEEFCKMEVGTRLALKEKALNESYEAKIAEFKDTAVGKLEEMADKYVKESLAEETAKITEKLEEKYAEKFEKLEESVLDNLDKFLDMEITSKISDELLEAVAINECHKPLIAGIFSLFESHLVGLDATGLKQIQEAEEKAKTFETKLNEAYQEKIKTHQKIDDLKTGLLIAQKADGLTEKNKNKIIKMFEGKSFDEVSGKIDSFVEILEENDTSIFETSSKNGSKKEMINEDIFAMDEVLESLNESSKETPEVDDEDDADFKFTNDINNLLRDK